jgi:hypothetical protein
MNIMPSLLQLVFDIKLQLTPLDIASLIVVAVFAAILFRRFKGTR